jgi:hypothetical protein
MDKTIFEVALVPVIIGISEAAKRVGFPTKYIPVLNLALGIVAGFVYVAPGNPQEAALVGIALGLSASGLYSGAKNVVEGIKGE